ncbi:MAG: general stress protein [Nostocoides sp.]
MSAQPNTRRVSPGTLQLDYPMSLGVFEKYEEAQKAVDYLSDHEFPVQNVMIVGTDLRQIERVTGRLTWGRVALGGVLSGLWLGAFVAMIFALFDSSAATVGAFVATMLFGAVFGLVWALIGYRFTGGDRDFTSVSQVVATRYEVLAEHKVAAQARELLAQMDPMKAAAEAVRRAQEEDRAANAAQQQPEA